MRERDVEEYVCDGCVCDACACARVCVQGGGYQCGVDAMWGRCDVWGE